MTFTLFNVGLALSMTGAMVCAGGVLMMMAAGAVAFLRWLGS